MRAPGLAFGVLIASCAARPAEPAKDPIELGDRVRAAAQAIVLCKTTEAEVRAAMTGAPPFRDGRIHRGRLLSWVESRSSNRFLAVLLDERGVVVDLVWDVPTETSWSPTSQCGATQ